MAAAVVVRRRRWTARSSHRHGRRSTRWNADPRSVDMLRLSARAALTRACVACGHGCCCCCCLPSLILFRIFHTQRIPTGGDCSKQSPDGDACVCACVRGAVQGRDARRRKQRAQGQGAARPIGMSRERAGSCSCAADSRSRAPDAVTKYFFRFFLRDAAMLCLALCKMLQCLAGGKSDGAWACRHAPLLW